MRMLHMAGTMGTTRVITDEGYLLVDATVSAEGVYPFRGSELDGPDDDENIQDVYLGPNVLFNEKTFQDISILPVTLGHPGPDVSPINYHELAKGHVMSGTVGSVGPGNGLGCKLLITAPEAIEAVQTHEAEEISLGFYADVADANGEFDGKKFLKKFILPLNVNHVAIVPKGRAGPQVRIHNAMPEGMETKVDPGYVKALTALRIKRRDMAELTADDMVDVIWSDPQKEVAAGELAAREGARKTTRELGPQPPEGRARLQWAKRVEDNTKLYETEIRRRVKRAARMGQVQGLISVALATGLVAVLADNIWNRATSGFGQKRIDNAPRIIWPPLDAFRRAVQFGSQAIDNQEVRDRIGARVHASVKRTLADHRAVSGRGAHGPGFRKEIGAVDAEEATAELTSQYNKLYWDLYNKWYAQALEDAQKFARLQVSAMLTIVAAAGGGVTVGVKFYDQIVNKVTEWIDRGGLDASMSEDAVRADMTRMDMKRRVKGKLKSPPKKGYPKGFVHGTIGGTLLGGLLGYGAGIGVSAARGMVEEATGKKPRPPYPYPPYEEMYGR